MRRPCRCGTSKFQRSRIFKKVHSFLLQVHAISLSLRASWTPWFQHQRSALKQWLSCALWHRTSVGSSLQSMDGPRGSVTNTTIGNSATSRMMLFSMIFCNLIVAPCTSTWTCRTVHVFVLTTAVYVVSTTVRFVFDSRGGQCC